VNRSQRRTRLKVTGDGKGIVAHAGARLLCDAADKYGLTDGCPEFDGSAHVFGGCEAVTWCSGL
jgi:hypothetical protein